MKRTFPFPSSIILALTPVVCGILPAEVVDDWSFRNPIPSYANLFNLAHGNGTYVVLGRGLGIHRTADFATWQTDYLDQLLENVIFADGGFTASGSDGEILRSTDGEAWTVHDSGTGVPLTGLVFGGGIYVATGQGGAFATSSNGTGWTPGNFADTGWYNEVAYGNGLFVAVSGDGVIMTGDDGSTWSSASFDASVPPFIYLYGVTHGAGGFVAGGEFEESSGVFGSLLLRSTDGLSWSRVTDPNIPDSANTPGTNQDYIDGFHYDGSNYIVSGGGGLILVSNDGVNWSPRLPGTTDDLFAVESAGGLTVAVGRRGTYSTTTDLATWSASAPLEGLGFGSWRTLAHGDDRFVIAGFSGLLSTSPDGQTWTSAAHPGSGTFTASAHGEGRFVLASSINTDGIPLVTSIDGSTWTAPSVPAGTETCNGVAHGADTFVASVTTGPSKLLVSDDGTVWSGVDPAGIGTLRGVAYGGGQFVAWASAAGGDPIRVAFSADGQTWEVRDTPVTSGAIGHAAFGDGRWVFVGSDGLVLGTTDFTAWDEQQIVFDGAAAEFLDEVIFAEGCWVIVARRHQFWSSDNGLDWVDAFTTGMTFPGDRIWDLIYDGEAFWGCGESGALMRSATLASTRGPVRLSIRKGPPGSVIVGVTGRQGDDWELWFSPDLSSVGREFRTTLTLGPETFDYTDPIDQGGVGFYLLEVPADP